MTIFDGRALRKGGEGLELPAKPALSKDLPVPKELFDSFLHVWNTLNIFGYAFSIYCKRCADLFVDGRSFSPISPWMISKLL